MKKKNITLVFVAIVFSIIVGMIIGKSLLKHKEGEPDVVGSFSMNRDENLTVVANRKNISDKEAFTRLLLKMYKENSFHSIKFSTDHGYANEMLQELPDVGQFILAMDTWFEKLMEK